MEMNWTIKFFLHKVKEWQELEAASLRTGPKAYASRQCAMWRQLAERATVLFNDCRVNYSVT
jgi:hypothetical protein